MDESEGSGAYRFSVRDHRMNDGTRPEHLSFNGTGCRPRTPDRV
jgi:hypothetical protein